MLDYQGKSLECKQTCCIGGVYLWVGLLNGTSKDLSNDAAIMLLYF